METIQTVGLHNVGPNFQRNGILQLVPLPSIILPERSVTTSLDLRVHLSPGFAERRVRHSLVNRHRRHFCCRAVAPDRTGRAGSSSRRLISSPEKVHYPRMGERKVLG